MEIHNFLIDIDFQTGFIIGTAIYIGSLYIYKTKIKHRKVDNIVVQ